MRGKNFLLRYTIAVATFLVAIGGFFMTASVVQAAQVTVHVQDTNGVVYDRFQVTAYNLDDESHLEDLAEPIGGATTTFPTIGTWSLIVDVDIGTQDANLYPWLYTGDPQILEVTSTNQNDTLTFIVTPAPTRAFIQLTDITGASLSEGNIRADLRISGYNSTYGHIQTRRSMNSAGVGEAYLFPGVYTVQVMDGDQLVNQSFDPQDMVFTVPAGVSEIDWGTKQAMQNSGSITGVLEKTTLDQPTSGDPLASVNVEITNLYNPLDTLTVATDANGQFTFTDLPFGQYVVTVDNANYHTLQSSTVELTDAVVTQETTLRTALVDTHVTGQVQLNSTAVTDVPAAVQTVVNDITFSAPVAADGSYELPLALEGTNVDTVEVQLVTQPGTTVFQADTLTVPVTLNTTITQNIAVSDAEAVVTGNITDFGGDTVSGAALGDNAMVMAINKDNNSVETGTIDSNGNFSLAVGAGTWDILPKIDDPAATVIYTPRSDASVTVAAGETKTGVELPVAEGEGTVTGTVTNPDGSPLSEAPVLLTNLPNLQATANQTGKALDPGEIITVSTQADVNGQFSEALPAGQFTVYFGTVPATAEFVQPKAETITVKADDTKIITSEYRTATATLQGVVEQAIESAQVVAYSPDGGTAILPVDASGNFSGGLTPGEWEVVTSGIKDDELWLQQETVTVKKGDNTYKPKLVSTDVVVPSTVATTKGANEPVVLSNSAGAMVSVPALAAELTGNITVSLAPEPNITFSNGIAQVGYSYSVDISNDEGVAVHQLNDNVTVTLPVETDLADDITTKEMVGSYYNKEFGTFLYDGMVSAVDENHVIIQTDHLSQFAVTADAAANAVKPSKPTLRKAIKLTTTSALVRWQVKDKTTVDYYTLQVRKAKSKKKKTWKTHDQLLTTQKTLKDLVSGTRYQFRVKACNEFDCTKYTKWGKFITKVKS